MYRATLTGDRRSFGGTSGEQEARRVPCAATRTGDNSDAYFRGERPRRLPPERATCRACSGIGQGLLTDGVALGYLDWTMARAISIKEDDVERLAGIAGVPISREELAAVATALGVLLTAAQLVSEFPLPDDVEAAPVFRP